MIDALMGIVAALAVILGGRAYFQRAGRKEAEKDMHNADKERALYIRRRTDAQRVRRPDEIDYRD